MRRTALLLATMAVVGVVAGGVALAAVIGCPNAANGYCFGTSVGDGMYGTYKVDRMYGFGGADLMYGYSSRDTMYGGDEFGWGDKILGGNWGDSISGQRGDDGLYGGNGNDTVRGGPGDDIVQGDYGNDWLYTGTGADRVNAQDGQKDWITCKGSANDLVYYDRGLDVLRHCGNAVRVGRLTYQANKLFEPESMILISHTGEELCVPETELKPHLEHGDRILNPQGCSNAKEGR